MAKIEAQGDWNQFGKVEKLTIAVHGTSDEKAAKIYANSRHTVEVVITVKIQDKAGNPLIVTNDLLNESLYFCHYKTGKSLDSSWLISDKPNEYTTGLGEKSDDTDSIKYVYKYISCSDKDTVERSEDISVGITNPAIGTFNTSEEGTTIDGRVFRMPKSIKITVEPPYDYGIKGNIDITPGDLETIKSDFKCLYRWRDTEGNPQEFDIPDGECKRQIFYIRPTKNLTGHEKFKEIKVDYKPVYNSDVCTDKIPWSWGQDENMTFGTVDAFSLLTGKWFYDKPGAVIGKGWHETDYQVNLWYSRKSRVRMDDKFYTADTGYYYRFNDGEDVIEEDHRDDDEEGLLLYKFIMAAKNTVQYKWRDVIRDITVKVFDFYGNEGSVQLDFNATDRFDKPVIKY